MTFINIKDKEFTNAYALCKQIDETFTQLKLADETLVSMEKKIGTTNQMDAMLITKVLDENGLNPRNTKDSVAKEILINIKEISSMSLDKEMYKTGMIASFNRLIHYKIANLENILFISGNGKIASDLEACLTRNKKVQKSILNNLRS